MARACEFCGKPLNGRALRWCSDRCRKRFCRQEAARARPATAEEPHGDLYEAYLRELVDRDVIHTPEAMSVLRLCEMIESKNTPASAIAALDKHLQESVRALRATSPDESDPVAAIRAAAARKRLEWAQDELSPRRLSRPKIVDDP